MKLQTKTPPNTDKIDRKPSVKRQVSWGPPTVAEADADTVKVKKVSKQNGFYNGNSNGNGGTKNNSGGNNFIRSN